MINFKGVGHHISAVNVIYPNDQVIKAIAQAAIVNMAEGDVEMLCDCSEQYPTKADLEQVFQGLHDQAADLIEETINELKTRLLAELAEKRYTARVTGLHYDDEGALSDITVSIDFDTPTA
jgi:hypothetical protein